MTEEQARIQKLREIWQKAKWFEMKASESFQECYRQLAEEHNNVEMALNAYLSALELSASRWEPPKTEGK